MYILILLMCFGYFKQNGKFEFLCKFMKSSSRNSCLAMSHTLIYPWWTRKCATCYTYNSLERGWCLSAFQVDDFGFETKNFQGRF